MAQSGAEFIVGLEVGWGADPSALAILERCPGGMASGPPARPEPSHYDLLHLERFDPGTAYPAIVETVGQLCRRPALHPTIDRVGWEGSRQVGPNPIAGYRGSA